MRHLLFLGLFCSLLALPVHAQVCEGDLTLSSQAQVDAFNCEVVIGDFVISGADITDLTPLTVLDSLDGSFSVVDNPVLPTLTGLENLGYMEGRDFRIEDNASLVSIAALAGLTTIDLSIIKVRNHPVLASLAGLENLTSADRCTFSNNDAVTSLTGLEGLTRCGMFLIQDNALLESMAGLENLSVVGWHFRIENNASLTSLSGLEGVFSVGQGLFSPGNLRIENNASLPSLSGLDGLASIGQNLIIVNNDALESLSGLESLTYIEEDLRIVGNDALESLSGLESLNNLVISLTLEDNGALAACSCGLAGIISGNPPAFDVNQPVTITGNASSGTCTSPAAVLVNPCTPEGPYDLVAVATTSTEVNPGGSIPFLYTVTNTTGSPVSGDLWFTTNLGEPAGQIVSGTLPAGRTFGGSFTQNIAGDTAPGTYSYTLSIGQFPNAIQDSVPFEITVTGLAREGGADAWKVSDVTPWPSVEKTDLVSSSEAVPEAFALEAAYPNPFALSTTVGFALPEAADVRVTVLDVLGREVAVLVDEPLEAGRHSAQFEAAGLASGVYLVRMTADGFTEVQRVTLMR